MEKTDRKPYLIKVAFHKSDFEELEELLNEGYRIRGQPSSVTYGDSCGLVYVLELEESEHIINVKSVDLNEVDKWLGEGYKVKELFAKTATLTKKGEVKA